MGMGRLGKESAQVANQTLAEREKELISKTQINWDNLRPKIGSEEDYKLLLNAVNEATEHNETVGSIFERLESLGKAGIALAEKVRKIVPV